MIAFYFLLAGFVAFLVWCWLDDFMDTELTTSDDDLWDDLGLDEGKPATDGIVKPETINVPLLLRVDSDGFFSASHLKNIPPEWEMPTSENTRCAVAFFAMCWACVCYIRLDESMGDYYMNQGREALDGVPDNGSSPVFEYVKHLESGVDREKAVRSPYTKI